MATAIGLEITSDRIAACQVEIGGKVRVVAAFSAALPKPIEPAHTAELAGWLKEKFAANNFNASDVVVGLGRGLCNIKTLETPNCPDSELPDIVRFSLEGDGIGADSVIDFHAGPAIGNSRQVTAVIALASTVSALREIGKLAGLNIRRLEPRGYGLRFLRERLLGRNTDRHELLLVPIPDGIDISVWNGNRMELSRQFQQQPGEIPNGRLQAELRRTLVAFHAGGGSQQIVGATLLAGPKYESTRVIAEALGFPLETTDPENKVAGWSDQNSAAAVGLAWDAGAGTASEINLLDPKKPPPPQFPVKRIATLGAILAGAIVVAIGYWLYREHGKLDDAIVGLRADLAVAEKQIKADAPTLAEHRRVKEWLDRRVNWLDEINYLASKLPETDESFITSLHGDAAGAQHSMRIQVRSRNTDAIQVAHMDIDSDSRFTVVPGLTDSLKTAADFAFQDSFLVWHDSQKQDKAGKAGKAPVTDELATRPMRPLAKGMKRVASTFGMLADRKTEVASGTGRSPGGNRRNGGNRTEPEKSANADATKTTSTVAKSDSGSESSGESELDDRVRKLAAMPLDEFERAILSTPSILRKKLRERVEKARKETSN